MASIADNRNLKDRPLLRLIFQNSVSRHALLQTMKLDPFQFRIIQKQKNPQKDKNKG